MDYLHRSHHAGAQPFTWLNGPGPINLFILGVRREIANPRRTRRRQQEQVHIAIVNTTAVSDLTAQVTGDHWITVALQYNLE